VRSGDWTLLVDGPRALRVNLRTDLGDSMFNLATVMFLSELEAEVALGTEIRRMTRALIVYVRRCTFPLTFEWDPDKAASNATIHGIDFRGIVQRWRDP
jgi:hypothetical protein